MLIGGFAVFHRLKDVQHIHKHLDIDQLIASVAEILNGGLSRLIAKVFISAIEHAPFSTNTSDVLTISASVNLGNARRPRISVKVSDRMLSLSCVCRPLRLAAGAGMRSRRALIPHGRPSVQTMLQIH